VSDERLRPKQVLIGEHDYARAPRFAWPGAVVIGREEHQHVIPGTWRLEPAPRVLVRPGPSAAAPSVADPVAWLAYQQRLLTMQEPGLQLRIGAHDGRSWRTLEVSVPSQPPMRVEVDRDAYRQLVGTDSIILRICACPEPSRSIHRAPADAVAT
jgi:hypothetical protein